MNHIQARQAQDLNARLAAVEVVLEAILPTICNRHDVCRSKLLALVEEMRNRRLNLEDQLDDRSRYISDHMLVRVERYIDRLAPSPEP